MATPSQHTPQAYRTSRASLLATVYTLLAVVGLCGTWYFNLSYQGGDYLKDWFANPASSSAAFDILTVLVACVLFYVREARRLGYNFWVPFTFAALSLIVAVAFALPLFLALREWRGSSQRLAS